MISFFKIFYRKYLSKNKLTALNISGLVLGMFTFMFIYFYVFAESNYDQFYENSSNIYHLNLDIKRNGKDLLYSNTPVHLAEEICNEIPGVKNWASYCSIYETSVVNIEDNNFLNPKILYVNPNFFEVFSCSTIDGFLKNALQSRGTAVLTKSTALKYFGTTNVTGRQLKILHDNKEPLYVTINAVVEDIPENSNIKFEIACNIDDYIEIIGDWVAGWNLKVSQSYVELENTINPQQVSAEMNRVVDKYMNNPNDPNSDIVHVFADKLSEKHFKKNYTLQHPTETFVNKNSLIILFLVGVITLIISWLNYINFSIFQSSGNLREVCIRKINGSGKTRLFFDLLKESMLLSLIPIVISVFLFFLLSPVLYNYFNFNSQNIQIHSGIFWISVLLFYIAGTLISTIYPLARLSSTQPIHILKKTRFNRGNIKKSAPVFTTLQFSLFILMLAGIFTINSQMLYLHRQDVGFDKDNILVVSPPVTESRAIYNQKMELFKMEAEKNPNVIALSASSSVPGKKLVTGNLGLKNRAETVNKYLGLSTDEDYFNTIGIDFVAGRGFSEDTGLRKKEVIINETLAHALGFKNARDAIDQQVNWPDTKIVGVVQDYHHLSLHDEVKPMFFEYGLDRLAYFMIRINSPEINDDLVLLKKNWETIFANSPFRYSFIDNEYNLQYKDENRLLKLTFFFTVVAILITIMGVIGTSLNLSNLRVKEIGIRKVNGAKVSEILTMLNKDFVKWVAIAFVIATPVAYYAMNKWLENFAYKTNLSWWIFVLAGVLALGIALLTVSWQSWKAATRNPVEALRYE